MTLQRSAVVASMVVAALLAVVVVVFVSLELVHRDEILPGVSVAGVEVGGLGRADAETALAPLVAERNAEPVIWTFQGRDFVLEPETGGYRVELESTLEAAMEVGRDDGLVASIWHHADAYWTQRPIDLAQSVDETALASWTEGVAAELDAEVFPGSVTADPATLEVTVEPPHQGVLVDQATMVERSAEALRTPQPETMELPAEVTPQRVDTAAIEEAGAQTRRALEAPMTLSAVGAAVTLQPADIAALINLEISPGPDDTDTVALVAPQDKVEAFFADKAGRFEVTPRSARFEVGRVPPTRLDTKGSVTWSKIPVDVGVTEATIGTTFDPGLAAAQISELIVAGSREAQLRLAEVDPDLTTEQANELRPTHLLGTFTTYHACCQSRVVNIQKLAELVDGAMVRPGEQFSINQISGNRTCERGFAPAGMILRGEIVDSCGGGVSQFGTTTFNAAFFSGLPLDAFQAHSFYISRYPMGREATLNYPSPDIDVRFTNNTPRAIIVKTTYSGTSITVSIYGGNDVASVRAELGAQTKPTNFTTEYRENRSLSPGTSRTVQSGRDGFTVSTSRTVNREGGAADTHTYTTRYKPEITIIERNSSPRAAPAPAAAPAPQPEPPPPLPPPPADSPAEEGQ